MRIKTIHFLYNSHRDLSFVQLNFFEEKSDERPSIWDSKITFFDFKFYTKNVFENSFELCSVFLSFIDP